MFNNLVESKPKKNKKMGGTIFSFIAHYGLILFVIYTSAQAATQDDGPKQEKVDFVEVKKEEAPKPKEPPPPELVAAPPPPKGFQVLTAPVEIPNVLPDIDLTRRVTNEADFTGKGAAGGFSTGAEVKTAVREDNTYFEFQVEKPVVPAPGSISPRYPDMLRQAGVEGEVLAQFVVDTTGKAEAGSLKILKSSHDMFVQSVKNALPQMKFIPAEVGGRKVKQLVQQPFTFSISK